MNDGFDDLGEYGFSPVPPSVLRKNALRGIISPPFSPPQMSVPGQQDAGQPYADQGSALQKQALDLMAQKPDVSQYQNFARQRSEEGKNALVMAMAAQRAGKGFEPVGAQFLKQSMEAQQPIAAGKSGMVTPQGEFMQDPEHDKEAKINLLMTTAAKYEQMAVRATDSQQRLQAQQEATRLHAQAQAEMGAFREGMLQVAHQNANTRQAATTSQMTPEALDYITERVLAGDKSALQNLGRGAQSAANLSAVNNNIQRLARERNLSPDAIARAQANVTAYGAGERSAAVTASNLTQAGQEARSMINIVRQTGADLGTSLTKFPALNEATIIALRNNGDPRVSKHAAAIQSLVNTYARAISPKGMPTVSDKQHAYDILSRGMATGQLHGVLDLMEQEIETAHNAITGSRAERAGMFFPEDSGQHPAQQSGPQAGWSVVR